MASTTGTAYSLALPQEYGYVLLAATSTFFVAGWHGTRTSKFRKAAKVPYPIPYAIPGTSDAVTAAAAESTDKTYPAAVSSGGWGSGSAKAKYLFNCAQRAHGNYLENQTQVLVAMLLAGVKYPIASSLLGVGWSFNRILYAVGYTRPDRESGRGRVLGMGWVICQLGLMLLTGWTGWSMVTGS